MPNERRRTRNRRERLRERQLARSGENKADRPALTIGEVFEAAVQDVLAIEEQTGFKGVVDVGVTLNSTSLHKSGLIGAVFGGEANESSIRVQLATRVHLDGGSSDSEE